MNFILIVTELWAKLMDEMQLLSINLTFLFCTITAGPIISLVFQPIQKYKWIYYKILEFNHFLEGVSENDYRGTYGITVDGSGELKLKFVTQVVKDFY